MNELLLALAKLVQAQVDWKVAQLQGMEHRAYMQGWNDGRAAQLLADEERDG